MNGRGRRGRVERGGGRWRGGEGRGSGKQKGRRKQKGEGETEGGWGEMGRGNEGSTERGGRPSGREETIIQIGSVTVQRVHHFKSVKTVASDLCCLP